MRYVQVPPPVGFVPSETQRKMGVEPSVFTFQDILNDVWLNNPTTFGKADGVRAGCRLEKLFNGKAPGEWIAVEEEDWKLLSQAVETTDYNPAVTRQLTSFLDAVSDAKKQAPSNT